MAILLAKMGEQLNAQERVYHIAMVIEPTYDCVLNYVVDFYCCCAFKGSNCHGEVSFGKLGQTCRLLLCVDRLDFLEKSQSW